MPRQIRQTDSSQIGAVEVVQRLFQITLDHETARPVAMAHAEAGLSDGTVDWIDTSISILGALALRKGDARSAVFENAVLPAPATDLGCSSQLKRFA